MHVNVKIHLLGKKWGFIMVGIGFLNKMVGGT